MSEKSLDQLIESLKTEGIEAAEQEAAKILAKAQAKAKGIVGEAEKKRAQLLADAEREASLLKHKGEAALQQAGRDHSILVRNELLRLFQAVFEAEIQEAFTPDLMQTAILKVIENISEEVELKLNPAFSKELGDSIHDRLKSSGQTISILEDHSILNGFSISQKDQGWTYAISSEAVAEALYKHLNKNWLEILKKGG